MRIKERFISLTAGTFKGTAPMAGIVTITSGTAVASVAAVAVDSGDVVLTGIMQYVSDQSSQLVPLTAAQSVRSGAFEIVCVGSFAPIDDMAVGWHVVRLR